MKKERVGNGSLGKGILLALVILWAAGAAAVLGAAAQPGSSGDPAVTKSWVDSYVTQALAPLEQKAAGLQTRVDHLTKEVAALKSSLKPAIVLTLGQKKAKVGATEHTLEVPPRLSGGRTLVPLRFIGEALGASFNWDAPSKTVTYSLAGRQVILTAGSTQARVDGSPVTLEAPAQVVDGRVLVPLRFIGESLGAAVQWDGATKTITVQP